MPSPTSRRDFLRRSATTLGAATAASVLPGSISRALAVDAAVRTGTVKDIEHVVILMQENRGFNHYFGTMRGVRGFGDRFPIPLESGKPVWYQSDGAREIPPYHLDPERSSALLIPSTPHSFADAQAAWNQGKLGHWPKYKTEYSMGYYRRDDIPFQFALAEAFTICDSYHCSITTGTDPNRITFWSGSNFNPELGRQGVNSGPDQSEPNNLRCWITGKWVPGAWPQTYKYASNAFAWDTIPDVLERAGISWHIYQDMNDNWTGAMNGCLAFESFRNAQPGTPVYEHGMTGGPDFLDRLRQDVLEGTLPQVSWVLTTASNSEHPGAGSSPTHGGNFTADVLDALTANPEVWSKTVFLLTFDENDGLFDHVPAPAVPSYNLDGTLAGKSTVPVDGEYFDASGKPSSWLKADDTVTGTTRPWGMGPRVPLYVVSPWSRGGWVDSEVFDHTSVGMFLEQRFGVQIDAISPWHRAVSGDLTSAFDFKHPNRQRFPELPDQSDWAASDAHQRTLPSPKAPTAPEPLFQERGTRYSRALPYELHTDASTDHGAGTVTLQFLNSGHKGAVFHVYDRLHLDRIPRRYTVEAGKRLADVWGALATDSGAYDLEVHGPGGFFRSFTGNTASKADPELRVRYDRHGKSVVLTVHNPGPKAVTLHVEPHAYRFTEPRTVHVPSHKEVERRWSLNPSGHWYDFTVTVDGSSLERRFAGRVETGKDGISDPAMAAHIQQAEGAVAAG
ncbi:phosphocholine-specific phospholipase C [Streptomyces sp. NBC_01727]|uniref:phosphocholine-specific phospholipase C n=1 Tax=Streptomyces sp. NBC_01727 TaxID=2975924 RepID=UPI002E128BB1|nr:phospholipase C, phosphocholine-specific [Streptomyces sp. NBC_01727]